MNHPTRERILQAATRLFADNGYRGASVRDICNLAGANPGAVSYHFGGKRQLYRAVLRGAASTLADMGPSADENGGNGEIGVHETLSRILRRVQSDDAATRLLLRDLADGGAVAVESLAPPLRSAFERLAFAIGHGDNPRASGEARLLFLGLAAPLFLLTAAWPVIARALELEPEQRASMLAQLVTRSLGAHGNDDLLER